MARRQALRSAPRNGSRERGWHFEWGRPGIESADLVNPVDVEGPGRLDQELDVALPTAATQAIPGCKEESRQLLRIVSTGQVA